MPEGRVDGWQAPARVRLQLSGGTTCVCVQRRMSTVTPAVKHSTRGAPMHTTAAARTSAEPANKYAGAVVPPISFFAVFWQTYIMAARTTQQAGLEHPGGHIGLFGALQPATLPPDSGATASGSVTRAGM